MRLRSELSESKELVEVGKVSDAQEFERLTNRHINRCFNREFLSGGRSVNRFAPGFHPRQTQGDFSLLLNNFEE